MTAVLLANVLTDAIEWLDDVSAQWWFLALVVAVAYFDSVVPIVPSETSVIIGGVAAGMGQYNVGWVILCGAVGAFLGDNTAYLLGARMSGWMSRRAERKPKFKRRLDWAAEQIRVRGGLLLITARFIPGGRTALTLSSGITHQPRRWFISWTALAAMIWATYAALLGYIGGKAFADNHTKAFIVAFGAALGITVLIEVVRHLRNNDVDVPVG